MEVVNNNIAIRKRKKKYIENKWVNINQMESERKIENEKPLTRRRRKKKTNREENCNKHSQIYVSFYWKRCRSFHSLATCPSTLQSFTHKKVTMEEKKIKFLMHKGIARGGKKKTRKKVKDWKVATFSIDGIVKWQSNALFWVWCVRQCLLLMQ